MRKRKSLLGKCRSVSERSPTWAMPSSPHRARVWCWSVQLLCLEEASMAPHSCTRFWAYTYNGDTFAGDTIVGDTFAGDTIAVDNFNGDTWAGV